MPMPNSVNGRPVRTGAWTEEEDRLLACYQEQYGNRWSKVCKAIAGRTGQQCAQRWRHKVNPIIKKEKWTPEEDQKLIDLYHEHGSAWAEISRHLIGRTDQQCMGRWKRHLDPGIRRDAWSHREDEDLILLHSKFGCQWAAIAKEMASGGRTAQQCRARWYHLEGEDKVFTQSATSTRKTAAKPRKSKTRKHSAYSESDEDCHQRDSDSACSEGFKQCSQPSHRSTPAARPKAAEDPEISDSELDGEIFNPQKLVTASCRKFRTRTRARELRYHEEPNTSQHSGQTVMALAMSGAQHSGQGLRSHEARAVHRSHPVNAESAAEDDDITQTPRSVSSMSARSLQLPSSSSPPFLAHEPSITQRRAESGLLGDIHCDQRSPSSRIFATPSRFAPRQSPKLALRTLEDPKSAFTSPRPVLSSRRQTTPNQRIHGSTWKTSPLDSVLTLLQSPDRRTKPEFLSPMFQNLTTPDWTANDWSSPPSTFKQRVAQTRSYLHDDIPSAGTPLSRGLTARKLDIESALRGQSSASRDFARQRPLAEDVKHRHMQKHQLGVVTSPAKRSNYSEDPSACRTPSKLQRHATHDNGLHSTCTPPHRNTLAPGQHLTEKENSACCALKQLSMIAVAMESSSGPMHGAEMDLASIEKLATEHEHYDTAGHSDLLLSRFQ